MPDKLDNTTKPGITDERKVRLDTGVSKLGEEFGYGAMMYSASELWGKMLNEKWKISGGEFVVGPCKSAIVECGCKRQSKCEWCCGTGWLTKHVKKLKDKTC